MDLYLLPYLTLSYFTGKACYRLALRPPVLFLSNVINSNRSPTFLSEDCRLAASDMIRCRLHSAEADTCENCELGLGSQIAVASPRLWNSLLMTRDGKEPKIFGSCSVRFRHRWNWEDVSMMVICYGITAIVSTS